MKDENKLIKHQWNQWSYDFIDEIPLTLLFSRRKDVISIKCPRSEQWGGLYSGLPTPSARAGHQFIAFILSGSYDV